MTRRGKLYKYLQIEFYAERGMITVIDTERAADSSCPPDEAIQRVSPSEFIKRAIAARMSAYDLYPSKTRELGRLLEDATTACKQAKAQGDPTDPKVRDHFRRHRRRSSALILPNEANQILGPVGGNKFKLKLGNPRDMLLRGAQVVPDLVISQTDFQSSPAKRPIRRA